MSGQALGLIETFGYIGAVEAADVCLKAAKVKLIEVEPAAGGFVTVKIMGDVGAIKVSIDASRCAIEKMGCLISSHVIPKPAADTSRLLRNTLNKCKSNNLFTPDFIRELNSMKVVELRALARKLEGICMERGHIKFATRKELLEAILEYNERKS